MKVTAQTLQVCLLGYVIHTATGSQPGYPDVLPGDDQLLIVGGHDCRPHSQPWQAALLVDSKLHCGGVLVHPRWVLSAAHCLLSSYTIGLGLHSLDPHQEPGSQMIEATESVPHPEYNTPPIANDLMLIRLSKPAEESKTIHTISIASQCPVPGTSCVVSGWGLLLNGTLPRVLQCLDVPLLSEESCQKAYPKEYDSSMLCAGGEENKDSCNGDSGGPLVCTNSERLTAPTVQGLSPEKRCLPGLRVWTEVLPTNNEDIFKATPSHPPGLYTREASCQIVSCPRPVTGAGSPHF
ncbi:kallikrein-4-like [Ctenodactylus gundi]